MHVKGEYLRGRYLIQGIIGNGGTSTVYLAIDTDIGKKWAIKEILMINDYAGYLADSEACHLKQLEHPSLPRIVEAWCDCRSYYIVSDYIEGVSLGYLIKKCPLSRNRTYHLLLQVLEVLTYLHELNPQILFLDLKPDNILVRTDGRVFLVDFGIAVNSPEGDIGFGTPGFAAPEQFERAELRNISVRTDIYAFGITYFCVRTGVHPEPDAEKMTQIIKECTLIGRAERSLILKCTHISPDKRFTSVRHIIRRLHFINFKFHKTYLWIPLAFFLALLIMIFLMKDIKKSSDEYYGGILAENIRTDSGGRLTEDSLKIISAYINSGKLDDADLQYYAFETARTYFEVYGDYREAEYYFSMLDEGKYPQRNYYLKLCGFQRDFAYDSGDIAICLDEFCRDVMLMPDSRVKYENLIFIAFCYSQYLSDRCYSEELLQGIYTKLENLEKEYEWKGEVLEEVLQGLEVVSE